MAAFLRHHESDRTQGSRHGFVWRLLHFFDLDHHFRLHELLTQRKRIDRKPYKNGQTPASMRNASIGEQHELLPSETDDPMEDKSSCGSNLKSLISQKMSKKMKKKKTSPSSQLHFPTSIRHHHVLQDDPTSSSEASTLEHSSSETDSSSGKDLSPLKSEGLAFLNTSKCMDPNQLKKLGDQFLDNQAILMEKLIKAKIKTSDTVSKKKKQKKGEHVMQYEAKDLTEVLELLNANTELFDKILQDSTLVQASNAQDQDSGVPDNLVRCGSFPGFSRFKQVGEGEKQGSYSNQVPTAKANGLQENKPRAAIKLDASGGFKDFKQRIKDVIKESKNEGARVSLDGVLHKIPYGSAGGGARKYGFVPKDNTSQGLRRSHSLASDSLEKYASLIESSSFIEPQGGKSGMKSSHQRVLQDNKPTRWGRTLSNPEIFSFRSLNLLEVDEPLACNAQTMTKSSATTINRTVHTLESFSLKQLPSIEEKSNETEYEVEANLGCIEEKPDEAEVFRLAQVVEIDNDDPKEASGDSDNLRAAGVGICKTIGGGLDQVTLIESHGSSEELEVSDDQEKPPKLSPVSVLGSLYPEQPISPVKYSILEENLQWCSNHDHGHMKELDSCTNPQMPKMDGDFDALNVRADDDHDDEVPEFNYVKDILNKYSSANKEFLPRWCLEHSSDVEGSANLLGLAGDWPDMPTDHQLLFDLINEVLLEIYASSSSFCQGFSHFHQRIRPMPVGPHILEEVWASISSHLASQSWPNPTFEHTVAQDFSKQDEWMNIRQDTDFLGLELEAWALGDLLDEVLADFQVVY